MYKRCGYKTDNHPLIGIVTNLIATYQTFYPNIPNAIKRPYGDKIKTDALLLFNQAIKQVEGKNYIARMVEILQALHGEICLVGVLNGLSKHAVMVLDCIVNEIYNRIDDISGQNVQAESE